MKIINKLISALIVLSVLVCGLVSCDQPPEGPSNVDYAASIELDMSTPSAKTEVKGVHMYIDGDTTHFNVSSDVVSGGILKARYIAINTPESTGKIEEWGNDAANFTKEKLMSAESIILESDTDDGKWNVDSTGERRVVWVWYKPEGSDSYRNLNIEILQSGLAFASNSANNRYGEVCMNALAQARANKLYVFGTDIDPDFPYGDPVPMLLKDIRLNIEEHYYMNVYFEGNVIMDDGGTIYVEEYDEATGMYYGITAYYGTSGLTGAGLKAIAVGNRVRLVGVITYFEGGDIWQVSDLYYDAFNPDDARCLEVIEVGGHEAAYPLTDINTFLGDKEITDSDGNKKTYKYADLALNTSISMENLTVVDAYTTSNGGSNDGAISLSCKSGDKTITVRTAVLTDENGDLVTQDYFLGKTINVKGIVEEYEGSYQIKVFSLSDVTFAE